MKTRHTEIFRSPAMFLEVMKLLTSYTFRLAARRFVMHELFGISNFFIYTKWHFVLGSVVFSPEIMTIFDGDLTVTIEKFTQNELYPHLAV